MPFQKLKRICLGIVVLLIVAIALWFYRSMAGDAYGFFEGYGGHCWQAVAFYCGRVLVLILALYVIAKILIEIFK